MANLETTENPQFSTEIEKLEPTTQAHASVFNGLNKKLLENDLYLENKKADKTIQHQVTLKTSNWIGESTPYSYILELAEVTKDSTINLIPSEDITAEQYTNLLSAQIEDATQIVGSITLQAKGSKPTMDIPILVLIGDSNVQISGGGAKTPLANNLLTKIAGVAALDALQGLVLDNKIACLSNTNLLINPDFRINQRGQDSYVEVNGYTVDRWISYNTLNVLPNGIKILNSKKEAALIWIKQNFETMLNGTYTASIKLRKNRANMPLILQCGNFVKDAIQNTEWQIISLTMDGAFDYIQLITADSIATDYIEIEWMKLELGSIATPFVSPDPATELVKCQRYYQVLGTGLTVVTRGMDIVLCYGMLRTKMRTIPTVSLRTTVIHIAVMEGEGYQVQTEHAKIYSSSITNTDIQFLIISGFSGLNIGQIAHWDTLDALALDAEIY